MLIRMQLYTFLCALALTAAKAYRPAKAALNLLLLLYFTGHTTQRTYIHHAGHPLHSSFTRIQVHI